MTDARDIVERLGYLHVWPQSIADTHADTLTPRQIERLYDVGNVAADAADTIASLRKQLEDARSLPTDDGWEDIATCETYAEVFVWCECETSGKRWATVAYKEKTTGRWYSEDDGYVPAKGWRPLPAPPSD